MYDIEHPYGPLIETTVRLAGWNVWARYGPWERREQAVAATLGAHSPDIVVLLEAWETADDHQAERLGARLGLPHYAFTGGLEEDGVTSGMAVMSRWPILQHDDQRLGDRGGRDGGSVLFTEIDGPRGPVQVFAAMLAWRLDHGLLRQGQVRDLAAYVAKTQNPLGPVFVCGDLNAGPDSEEVRMLTGRAGVAAPGLVFYDAWELAGDGGPGTTWSNANPWAAPALFPERRIDYVLSAWPRPGGAGHPVRCEVIGAEAVDGVLPSDHYGVLADLRY
ncbi:endonuclease/exonuclease/phosphatase family protein [Actinomadura scrupuli]|uniref:endonuclease/exonuclease/phosphatase family protein n=1 Tax=Actinomadura scrupuli TaxID=559629 RepID=UPI003D968D4C